MLFKGTALVRKYVMQLKSIRKSNFVSATDFFSIQLIFTFYLPSIRMVLSGRPSVRHTLFTPFSSSDFHETCRIYWYLEIGCPGNVVLVVWPRSIQFSPAFDLVRIRTQLFYIFNQNSKILIFGRMRAKNAIIHANFDINSKNTQFYQCF